MKTVAILGCGPAGLLAAHAVEQSGNTPVIFSKSLEKSIIPGSQYLHESIPGLTNVYPDNSVQYVRLGDAQTYARKVYGDAARETGWKNYLATYPSWNVLRAYDVLWEKYGETVHPTTVESPTTVHELLESYEIVISTIPAQNVCFSRAHEFKGVDFYIKTLPTPDEDRSHDIVIYNGMRSDEWYRWSILGGVCSIETTSWSYTDEDWSEGVKAVSNTCNCFPTLHRAGRWAEWTHGVLLHDAYKKVVDLMGAQA